jgi:hypothetical protein
MDGHLLDAEVGAFQKIPGLLQPHGLQVLRWRDAGLNPKQMRESRDGKRDGGCQVGQAQFDVKTVLHQRLHLADPGIKIELPWRAQQN